MNKLNVAHIFCSTLHSEPRLLKSILSVKNKIDHVYIIGLYSTSHGVHLEGHVNHSIHKFRTFLGSIPKIRYKAFVRYYLWYARVFFFFLFKKLDLIHAHSIEDLPIARILCKIKNAKLIYEPHELETERVGWFGFNKKLAKKVEKKLIYKVDKINVVSPTIQEWYSKSYDLNKEKIKIIRNIPIMDHIDQDEKTLNNSLRKKFLIPESSILFIYQGAIQESRGIDILLESFSTLTEKHQIIFLGNGNKKENVIQYAEKCENIHYHEKVDYSKLIYLTKEADIGIHMIENKCLNNYYCLPNKIFEYLFSNIAVLTSNFPDMEEIIKKYNAGWTCDPNKEDLINLIRTINKDDLIKKTQYSFNERWENDYSDQKNYYSKLIQ